jgi:error-prone DNA polymerase
MHVIWHNYPQFLKNTLTIAERCNFRLTALKPSLPHFPTPNNLSHDQFLEQLVWQGTKEKFDNFTDKHKEQINHELNVIKRMQFAPYFLIMWDIVVFARSKEILVQGRGSAANSVVCYCLGITAVDPVDMNLLFERFICEDANEPPDIDLDIAHQRREIVLQYVYEKYGRQHAGMVCEAITYRGKSAVRDAARVLGFSAEQTDRLAAQVSRSEAKEAALSLYQFGIKEAGLDINDKRVQLLIKVVAGLHTLPRHRSIHVGGFVLSGEPLGRLVPIEPAAMPNRTVIQWDKDDLIPMGMFKIDLLGLGMLSMIQEAKRLIKLHRNIDFDLYKIDKHDQEVFAMLQKADTIGIFQIESRAQMAILPKLHPTCFYDLVVSIALVRPGPIQGNIVHPYLRRRRGLEDITYPHDSLKPILERTLGVPLFQEQGMRIAVIAASFTATEADQLRRVMSFKRAKEKMSALCDKLAAGMRKNGLKEEAIISITNQLRGFANYGFPESHSASFALIAYASAYLKKHFAPEFYCASLNAQPLGFYNPNTLIQDAQRHGVKVLPIDVAKSTWDCTLKDGQLRIGLRYMNGLDAKSKQLLEKTWSESGTFTSPEDLHTRSQLGAKKIKNLAKAGALESFIPERRKALWEIIALNKKLEKPKQETQLPLGNIQLTLADLNISPMNELEKTIADYQTQHLSTHAHIMQFYRPWAKSQNIRACADLEHGIHNEYVTVAACVICRQHPPTAKGFVFFTLEDETGLANIVIKPKIFEVYKKILIEESFIAISGPLQIDEGVINIIAQHAKKLSPLPSLIELILTINVIQHRVPI